LFNNVIRKYLKILVAVFNSNYNQRILRQIFIFAAHCRRVAERDEEAEEVQPGEARADGQQEHQGLVTNDQENAATSKGSLQILNPLASGRRVHEKLSGNIISSFQNNPI
jgi:hypothetical protein